LEVRAEITDREIAWGDNEGGGGSSAILETPQ
jgi:hypothetical protein